MTQLPDATQPEITNKPQTFASDAVAIVERLSKVSAVFVVFTYLCGFLVVRSRLANYGVPVLTVLHLKYLVAGVIALSPIVACLAWCYAGWKHQQHRRTRFLAFRNFLIISSGLMMGFAVLYAFARISLRDMGILFLGMYLFIISIALALFLCIRSIPFSRTSIGYGAPIPIVSVFLVIMIAMYSMIFGLDIYSKIPYAYGGGAPLPVRFIKGEKAIPAVLILEKNSEQTVPYLLLESSEKSYYIISPNKYEMSMEIDRSSVGGLIVLRDTDFPRSTPSIPIPATK